MKQRDIRKFNPIAKDLRTPKYRIRIVELKTVYKRQKFKEYQND
jgi:hypothetical protein